MSAHRAADAGRQGEPSFSPTNPMYIDPAAGSLVLQVLIAGVLAVTTTMKSARQSVMRQFRRLFSSHRDE
jgi:hypothetical protein